MSIRASHVARCLALALICLIVLNAQAWASHVHWPTAADTTSQAVQTDASVTDVHANAPDATTGNTLDTGHSDHCCHAGAHLVGLHRDTDAGFAEAMRINIARIDTRYVSVAHAPPVDPPIA